MHKSPSHWTYVEMGGEVTPSLACVGAIRVCVSVCACIWGEPLTVGRQCSPGHSNLIPSGCKAIIRQHDQIHLYM